MKQSIQKPFGIRRSLAAILVCALLLAMAPVCAYGATTAYIDGGNSDRVHLRASASMNAASLGLYFTGTQVECISNPGGEWVNVIIGSEQGFIRSEYISATSSIVSRQPTAVVTNTTGTFANVRNAPSYSGGIVATANNGETLTVLGETADHWYYVLAGSNYGYVQAGLLTIGATTVAPVAHGYEVLYYRPTPTVSIQYPYFTGSGQDALNTMVFEKAQSIVQSDLSGLTMNYQCAVTLHNSRAVSMVFWGNSDVQGGAYPTTGLEALTVDLTTLQPLTLWDMYAVDTSFVNLFIGNAYFPSAPTTSYDATVFEDMLSLQQSFVEQGTSPLQTGSDVVCFLKPDGIVLSLPSIHATGSDHFEAQVDYDVFHTFYRLRTLLWQD